MTEATEAKAKRAYAAWATSLDWVNHTASGAPAIAHGGGLPLPPWDGLAPRVRDAWGAAVEALEVS